jgi:hypothetical protein
MGELVGIIIAGTVASVIVNTLIVGAITGSLKSSGTTFFLALAAKVIVFTLTIATVQATAPKAASAVLYVGAFVLIWAPTLLLRWVIVPLRMRRAAYWAVRVCWPLGLAMEIEAGAVIHGALALARTRPSDEDITWLERKIRNAKTIHGAGVVAAGLLAALRNDIDRARGLLVTADEMYGRLISRSMRAIARDWLVMDAARVGNWHKVIRLGRGGSTWLRWSHSMARIGERLTGDPQAWHNWQLWLCFLWAPRRRATYPLFRRALAVPVRRSTLPEPAPTSAGLPLALGDLARAIGGACDGKVLARSMSAVDRQLETMRDKIEERLNALAGQGDAGAILSAFRQRLIDLVTPLIEDDPYLARDAQRRSIMEQAVLQTRERLFGDLEARCQDYRKRTAAASFLDLFAEWETWAGLHSSAEQLLELDPDAEAVLFQAIFASVYNFAVVQRNRRERSALALDMFAWLLRRAGSNPKAREMLARNVRAEAIGI